MLIGHHPNNLSVGVHLFIAAATVTGALLIMGFVRLRLKTLDDLYVMFGLFVVFYGAVLVLMFLMPVFGGASLSLRLCLVMFLWVVFAVSCAWVPLFPLLGFSLFGLFAIAPMGLRLFDYESVIQALYRNSLFGSVVAGLVFLTLCGIAFAIVRVHMHNRSAIEKTGAAANYAASTELESLDQAQVDAIVEEIFAPSTRTKGVDPNWVIERLRDILVAPGVHVVKNEKALQAALMQIEILRDDFVPMMMGYTGHDLRLCLEAKHKCRSAEMKVKANLFRTESRGLHYRSDYPFRNDEEWLCHVGVSLDENGEVVCRKIDIPDSWKGDTSKKHEERYLVLFPGEADALGIEVEESGR